MKTKFPFNQGATELRDAFDAALVKLLDDGTVDALTAAYGIGPADRPSSDDPGLEEECAG